MGDGSFPNNSQGASGGPSQMVGYLDRNYVYGVHTRQDAGGVAFRYNRSTGATQTIDLSTVVGNVLHLPLLDPTDGHYGLVCGVDRADYFHVVGNNHDGLLSPGTVMHHVVCTNPAAFTNPASWVQGAEPGAALDSSAVAGTYTYNHFDRLTNGDLLWFHSQSPTPTSSRGRAILAYRATAGDTWTPVLSSGGRFCVSATDLPQGTTADRVYVNSVLVDPVYSVDNIFLYDLIWYYGVWRTFDDDVEYQQQPFVFYGKSTNLDQWFAVDGTALTMPYVWATRAPALAPYANVYTNNPRNGIWTVPGPPPKAVAITVQNGNTTVGDATYHRLSFNGTAWAENPAGDTGGLSVIELNLPRNQHVTMWNAYGRVNFRGFVGGPAYNYNVGPNVYNLGGGKFVPKHCPVLLREDKVWLANIGDATSPRIYTVGDGYPGKVTA